MENIMSHIANGLIHFGWAMAAQECTDECVWPKFNWLARLMGGVCNRLHGLPWSLDDFTQEDVETWWNTVDNPNMLDRIGGWFYRTCHRSAFYLDDKYNGNLI